MKILIGVVLCAAGIVTMLFGDRSIGKYGTISKWIFNPPWLEKYTLFLRRLQSWVVGGLMLFLGVMALLGRF